jgi:hypothetical protein
MFCAEYDGIWGVFTGTERAYCPFMMKYMFTSHRPNSLRLLLATLAGSVAIALVSGCSDGAADSPEAPEADLKKKKPDAGAPILKGLGCKEPVGAPYALELEWFPPKPLELVANNGRQYNELIPMVPSVAASSVSGTVSYTRNGIPHVARLNVPRADRPGSISIDGTEFALLCYYVKTSAWERD